MKVTLRSQGGFLLFLSKWGLLPPNGIYCLW
jgi:hypothetical protein